MTAAGTGASLRTHVHETGTIRLSHPPNRVFPLLTPEGERAWVAGWSPIYPALEGAQDTPGTVFLTANHGAEAVWIIADRDDRQRSASYAYVIPNVRATLVRVTCSDDGRGGTEARIDYSVTSLSPNADDTVRSFSDGFQGMLTQWTRDMSAALAE